MSDKKSWLTRLNPFQSSEKSIDVKQLSEKYDALLGELQDQMPYEQKFMDTEPSGFNTQYSADYSGIDQQLDAAALQRLYSTETWVYTAVTEIAKTIGSLPLKLEKRQKVVKQIRNEVTGLAESVQKDIWVDASSEKLFKRFESPNKWTTKTEWLMLLAIDLLTAGEYFIYLDSDVDLTAIDASDSNDLPDDSPWARLQRAIAQDAPIKGMYRIPPPLIKPIPSIDKSYIEGYAMQSDKGVFAFNFAEIIHVKLPNPNDPYRGLSPLVAAFKPVLLDRFSTEHMVRFYKTGARLGGVIETAKSLNKEQLGRFQRSFENNFTGRRNHHRTLILPPGMSYKQIEQNPAETALLEFCRYNREAILSVYHVPPIKVGIMDNANYANARVQLQIFFTDTIKPLLQFIQDGYNLKNSLMPGNNSYRVVFDLSDVEVMKEDLAALADAAAKMLKAGQTINEVREKIWKLGPIPGGDQSFNVAEIKKMENGQAGSVIDDSKDGPIAGLNTTNQSQLIPVAVGTGKPKDPTDTKCEKCKKSPCICPPEDNGGKDGGKQSQAEFIKDSLSKLDASEVITPELIQELIGIYNEMNGAAPLDTSKEIIADSSAVVTPDTASVQGDIITTPKVYGFGWSKDEVVSNWKSFISQTDPLVTARHAAISKWLKSLKSLISNRLGANIKSFGLHKARDEDDVNEILDPSAFDSSVKDYIAQIDETLKAAYEMGYSDTLAEFKFGLPNEKAIEFLKQYGAAEVTQVLETLRAEMKDVLSDAFEEGVAMGEVSSRLQDKFDEVDDGRAWTIARTETLSAVSAGREEKRQDWQKQFPDKKLMKMWVSAQDDKVRDSHEEVDGESVESSEEFSNGLKYPREQGGAPEEVINCRCTDITFPAEDEDTIDDTLNGGETGSEDDKED